MAHGQRVFESMGCVVCHATEKDDDSAKTGPNLYGLFLTEPHDVEVLHATSGTRRHVAADEVYFKRSVRQPAKELAVANRVRVARARVVGMSGRALYVGLPGHLNYGFDPRFLSLRKVWTGGFLNLKEERSGRGGRPSALGHGAKVVMDGEPLLAPLTRAGKRVDFEFKEPDVGDDAAIVKHLQDDEDFVSKLAALDTEFLGHRLMPWSGGGPLFRFRVGHNQLEESIQLLPTGGLMISIRAKLATPQAFALRTAGLAEVSVSGGTLADGQWQLPAAPEWTTYVLTARIEGLAPEPMLPAGAVENWQPQALSVAPAEAGRVAIKLPNGCRMLTWQAPLDLFGRKQVFEPTGIDVAKDGTIVLATRASGVWRIRDGRWSLFAEGSYECLGVCIEDDKGDRIVVAQKPELTRMIDSNGDGRADRFDTVCDDYGFHANYHDYTHGPVRDAMGNYYFTLNLAHSRNQQASWRGGSKVMGSMAGYRGWACRVTPVGRFEPYAGGLRSPAGIGIDPHGRLWLPQSRLCNSPVNPAWDRTGGRFGPYGGQVFIGDQTQSRLMRVVTEQVDGIDQGAVMPFAEGLASGAMRLCFLPDGSLLVGQTGRDWGAKGGQQFALQQVIWDGKTVTPDILKVTSRPRGFDLRLTLPLDPKISGQDLREKTKVESWYYINSPGYGSPEEGLRSDPLAKALVSADRMTVHLEFTNFGVSDAWLDRIYQITLEGAGGGFDTAPVDQQLRAYFTLRAVPQ